MKRILFLYTAVLLSGCSENSNEELPVEIFFDLETTKGVKFSTGDYEFGSSISQTNAAFRSGKYSSGINAKNPFALAFHLRDVEKGHYVSISVWRKSSNGKGVLGIEDVDGVIKLVSNPIKKENDWELLQYSLLAEKNYSFLKIYVHNPSDELVFFDDFSIKHFESKPLPELSENSLRIKIGSNEYQMLNQFRNEALENGVIGKAQKKYVEGTILFNNKSIPVKLRLKGDWTDHLEGNKWSLRIKVRGNNSIYGFKSFSIQSPHTRAFLREWVMHKLYENEDVLTTRYLFSTVSLNDENLGIFAVEEHFDKQLVESKQKREGPILKFNEDGFWERNSLGKDEGKWVNTAFYEAAEVMPFKKKRTLNSPTLKENFQEAEELMLRYKNFDRDIGDLFDLDALAKYFALADLGNVSHGLRWHNMRMYYNPITHKLEQVAFDCFTENLFEEKRVPILGFDAAKTPCSTEDYLTYQVFNHSRFKELYTGYLEKYSNTDYLENLFSSLAHELDSIEKWMQVEYPNYIENRDFFIENAADIRDLLEDYKSSDIAYTYGPTIPTKLSESNIYFPSVGLKGVKKRSADSNFIDVELFNYHAEQIVVIGHGECPRDSCCYYLKEPIPLDGYKANNESVTTQLPRKSKHLFFSVENLKDSILTTKIDKWKTMSKLSTGPEIKNVIGAKFPEWIIVNETEKLISFARGNHEITKNLIIPEGYTVSIPKGTVLDLRNSAAIISYSRVLAEGTSNENIIIHSSDATGQGLVIINKNEESILTFVTFKNLTNVHQGNWTLTGAVTIYQSQLSIKNCTFINNNSEDALNLVRSSFTIENLLVENAVSDGLDADFCIGEVLNSTFVNAANDCLDFSGSKVLVKGCRIDKAGDKGISGGENSEITINGCFIEYTNIAVAAKDKTTMDLDSTVINNSNCGYAVYQKKAEYGTAKINVQNGTEKNVSELFLIDQGSSIRINNDDHYSEKRVNVDSLYTAFK